MISPLYRITVPRTVVTGAGSASDLPNVVASLGATSALVVTDRLLVERGVVGPAIEMLREAGVLAGVYDGVVTEPTVPYVTDVVELLRSSGGDAFVALGGGSAIDTAKAASAILEESEPLATFEGYGRFSKAYVPVVAVPTTAGTGSEVTRVAVITDTDRDVKMLFVDDALLPAAAVVDPALTVSCPPAVTASAGMDALSHAIEAYVSRRAQPFTDALALSAARLIAGSIRTAMADGADMTARSRMMDGQLQAGLAFSNASVALVHGMSRPLGAVFGVPHGIANAMLLPVVTRYSLEGAPARYDDLARVLWEAYPYEDDADRSAADFVERLAADLGIPTLGGFGVDNASFERSLEKLASDAIASGSPANNPRVPTHAEIVELYRLAF